MSYITNNPKRVITGLTTVLVAAGVAVGSGATFTSSTANPTNTFTAGTLEQTNSKDNQVVLSAANMKPGDTTTGKVTITNTGSLPGTFSLAESADTNAFGDDLTLKIADETGTAVYDGTFGGITSDLPLGRFAAETGAHTYTFTVQLAQATPNSKQGFKAAATFTWNATQDAATTTDVDAG